MNTNLSKTSRCDGCHSHRKEPELTRRNQGINFSNCDSTLFLRSVITARSTPLHLSSPRSSEQGSVPPQLRCIVRAESLGLGSHLTLAQWISFVRLMLLVSSEQIVPQSPFVNLMTGRARGAELPKETLGVRTGSC